MFLVNELADDPKMALWEEGRLTELARLLQQDVSRARASRNAVKETEALSSLVFLFGMLDQWPDAVKAAQANLKVLKNLGCPSTIAGGAASLAEALEKSGRPCQALRLQWLAFSMYRQIEETEGILVEGYTLGRMLKTQGRTEDAMVVLHEALAAEPDRGICMIKAAASELLSDLYRERGDLPSAIHYQFQSVQAAGCVNPTRHERLANLYFDAGLEWEGQEILKAVVESLRSRGESSEASAIERKVKQKRRTYDPNFINRLWGDYPARKSFSGH
jgi:tetratricopeptide (TPR) repeat protein